MSFTRRGVLGGVLSSVATGVMAEAPFTSMRPRARIVPTADLGTIIRRARLSGDVGCVLADLESGEVLQEVAPDLRLPPASVTKAVTALYALETLGPAHRFATRLLATGPLVNGVLDGDLILAGGGDPNLVTDQLATLADRLKDTGLSTVNGDFLVWDDALVNLDEIDPSQLDHLGYNPTITGLNLNFNRVYFEWKRSGDDYTTVLDARSENFKPQVTSARMAVVNRASPVFTYRGREGVDEWTVARRALNNGGSRWLPVRNPARYAGEVFATFARSHGIVLAAPKEIADLPQISELAVFESRPLEQMMRGMLRFSTNITAEAAGLATSAAASGQRRGLRTSALSMARWAEQRAGARANFVDHSGLGDQSRISAADMVKFLSADGVRATLHPILKPVTLTDRSGDRLSEFPGEVRGKTGTLNFVSSLAGYVRAQSGRQLSFAFFAADLAAREAGKRAGDESPRGAVGWNRAAKRLQQDILQNWIRLL
ncbi:D-alanyl-D-alanine carboxypeptidase/D-alanyl-D-alanine endopeptidase [Yoonia sp. 2307UL14-13]|uniref:D-alanyl-D-alanine carboxypeptidase/D-alanyl-D-alanine endopeptidase n=1 Tax=Yoonia sp. 2307UL14-13 TaxID=3126506 RepID=UPI0030A4A80C